MLGVFGGKYRTKSRGKLWGKVRGKVWCKFCIISFIFMLACAMPCFAEDFSEYMDNLRGKIQKAWIPPECLEKDGHAMVKFSVTRSGDIYSLEMLEPSGDLVFDESAMDAIRKAAPFGNFPAETSRGSLTIKYSFDTSVVNTGKMRGYLAEADRLYNVNNREALYYINMAIDEVDGDIRSYFLYSRRSKIRKALGDIDGARADMDEANRLKAKYDRKRILASKIYAEMEQSPFSYFSLANSYDIAGDYEQALIAINKAISLTDLNNSYKRYKKELEEKCLKKL